MTEPNYEYVKGQGWVIVTGPVVTTKDNRTVRLVERLPIKNERYWRFHKLFDRHWFKDNSIDLDYVAKQTELWRCTDFACYSGHFNPDYIYVVLELL